MIPHHLVTLGPSETCPHRLQCSHDSGKKTAHFSAPRSMQFGAHLSPIFFFPFFVVKYWVGWRGSTQVSGVSLLVHYVSESATQWRTNVKHSHLTGASFGPRTSSVTLRAQFWETLTQVYSLSNNNFLSTCQASGTMIMHVAHENG